MDSGRIRRAFLNFLSAFGLTFVTFGTALISSRLVIRYIGDERFGAFRSLFELFGYLSLLEGGLALTLRPLFAQSLAKNQNEEVADLMHASFVTFRAGMFAMLAAGLSITVIIHRIVPVSPDSVMDLRIASFVMACGLGNICFGPLRTLCEAMQRSFLTNLLLIFQTVCITITTTLMCYRYPEWGISIQASSVIFWVTFFNWVMRSVVLRLRRSMAVPESSGNRNAISIRELFRNSRNSFVFMLTGRVSIQSNSLILGLFVGQSDVTKLYATQRLFDVIQSQLFGVGNASWAAMAEIYHQGKIELFRKRIGQLIQLLLVMGISTVIPVYFFNRGFVTICYGSERYGGDLLTLIMAINAIALSFTVFSTWCLTGTGMLKSVLRMTIVTSSLDVTCTLLFTWIWGRVGPVLGSCVVLCLISIPWHFHFLSIHFGLSVRDVIRTNLRLAAFACIYFAFVGWLHAAVVVDSWLRLALVMGLPSLGFLAGSLIFILDADQKSILKQKFGIRR